MDRPQLFVSHHSSKAQIARQIVDELERRGVRCWLAPRDIAPGQAFDRAIADAMGEVDAILVLFCEEADSSRHVRREVIMADEGGKAILPLRLDRVAPDELAYWFKDAQWIDWLDGRSGALDRIARQVKALGEPPAAAAVVDPPAQPAPAFAPPPEPKKTGAPWHLLVIGWWVVGYTLLTLPVLLYFLVEPSGAVPGTPEPPPAWAGPLATLVGFSTLAAGVLLLLRRRWATLAFGVALGISIFQHAALLVSGDLTGDAIMIAFTGWIFLGLFGIYSWQMGKKCVLS